MKKIISLICIFAVLASVLASCGKPSFIPMEDGGITGLFWGKGSTKNINSEEYRDLVFKAYNATTEVEEFKDVDAKWLMVAVCGSDDESRSTFSFAGFGDERFNVTVSGAAAGGGEKKFMIYNMDLMKIITDKMLVERSVNLKVNVKFVLAAGTPDADGGVRGADEVISESLQTVEVRDGEKSTAFRTVKQALTLGSFDGYKTDENAFRVTMINGYEESVEDGETEVRNLHWVISVNGEELPSAAVSEANIDDGDEIVVKYVLDTVEK